MARKAGADLLAAKERRKKKLAIVGAVLLVAVLAIQVPRTMNMLNRPSGPAARRGRVARQRAARGLHALLSQGSVPAADPGGRRRRRLRKVSRATGREAENHERAQVRPCGRERAERKTKARPAARPRRSQPSGAGHVGADLDQRRARGGQDRRRVPSLGQALHVGLSGPWRREDRDLGRLARRRRQDGHARARQGSHAREHRKRRPLQAASALHLLGAAPRD
jgi:hypothetical protein